MSAGTEDNGTWRGFKQKASLDDNESSLIKRSFEFGKDVMRRSTVDPDLIVNIYSKAIIKKELNKRHYKQNSLSSGDVTELFVAHREINNIMICGNHNGEGISIPFCIHVIVGAKDESPWAVCSKLRKVNEKNMYKIHDSATSKLTLVKLN